MKKAGLLAMLLAGALVLGLGVGCGEKENQGGTEQGGTQQGGTQQGGTEHAHAFAEGWTSDGEYHWHDATCGHADAVTKEAHTFQNGECTTCHYYKIDKDTDLTALVSDKLTEEEWKEALSEETLENFKESYYQEGPSYSPEGITLVFSFAGENWQQEYYMDGFDPMIACSIIEFKDGLISFYQLGQYEYWERVKLAQEQYDNKVWETVGGLRLELLSLREKYSQMTYDETLGAYLFTETDETHSMFVNKKIALKFKNGKLCGFGFDDPGSVFLHFQSGFGYVLVYGYGEAQIVPPTEFQEREAHGDDWD